MSTTKINCNFYIFTGTLITGYKVYTFSEQRIHKLGIIKLFTTVLYIAHSFCRIDQKLF
jgi:hypothetical protein